MEYPNIIRQGDVVLVRIKSLPEGLKAAARDQHGHIVLAYGEQSGHRHSIREKDVTAFRMESAERDALTGEYDYIQVGGSSAQLNHEYVTGVKAEHEPAMLAPDGVYKVVLQRSYSPAAIIRAAD